MHTILGGIVRRSHSARAGHAPEQTVMRVYDRAGALVRESSWDAATHTWQNRAITLSDSVRQRPISVYVNPPGSAFLYHSPADTVGAVASIDTVEGAPENEIDSAWTYVTARYKSVSRVSTNEYSDYAGEIYWDASGGVGDVNDGGH